MPDGGTQTQGPRRGRAWALSRPLNRAKGYGDDLKAPNREIQRALKRGCDMDFISTLREMTDPLGGDG